MWYVPKLGLYDSRQRSISHDSHVAHDSVNSKKILGNQPIPSFRFSLTRFAGGTET
jgi:hypothetical protein